jgi:ABC-2 type transport system ATP-binding protein
MELKVQHPLPVEERSIPETVIDVRGITKRFFLRPEQRPGSWLDATIQTVAGKLRGSGRWVAAVENVDLQVRRGEILGLLGPNGAGKTTLIKMLCGLLVPTGGNGTVLGFDLLREDRRIRANVSLVAPTADVGTDNNLTVRQNLDFWAFVYNIPAEERQERIDELLTVVDLVAAQDAWPMHISAGMRQRLAIARSLLARNPLIFLDEPTVKLDPEGARRIRSFIADLRVRYGVTIILTTHYMFEAEELCDRIAIMEMGRIIALDTPAELKSLVSNERRIDIETVKLPAAIDETVRQLPAVLTAEITRDEATGATLSVHTLDIEATTTPLLTLLRAHGVTIRAVRSHEPTLEEVFFALAGREGR